MGVLHFVYPFRHVVPFPESLTGVVPILLGIILNLMADRALKVYETTVKPFEVSTSLVTEGVYRLSRHPMYLGFILILIGMALCLGSVTPWGIVTVFGLLLDRQFITHEERMLEKAFGATWREYAVKVRRWI